MRMIDFRAWDKKKSEIVDVMDIDFSGKKVGVCNVPKRMFKDGRLHTIHSIERDWSEVELMQYTGLKDKNGTEIFEGDIIEYNGKANDHGIPWGWEFTTSGKGVVKYDLAGYLVFDLHTDNLVKENLNEFLIQYEEIDVIVIGNVYENSELLEEI